MALDPIVLWLSLAGTSLFVLAVLLHAYRLTSPLGSPRSFGSSSGGRLKVVCPSSRAVAEATYTGGPSERSFAEFLCMLVRQSLCIVCTSRVVSSTTKYICDDSAIN
mgnify:CR=1 FL=1